ncbi:biotin carboxylase N-terminal domain-containing protein [Microbacterium sp. NPDC096154]|uniref:acetyl-CoA carboxylase biotin carboxylase subunit n=1 Tax=Microbacterium sp. NPDC096154 TaxID=3155549 RepID=UPI0033321024
MRRVLVANRGEIAVRVIRACHDEGIEAVAVYSEADADALHVRLADAAVLVGPAPAAESYLRQEALIEAARSAGADAVHPGYGFLSENADFARRVEQAGLIWIGPPADVIERMGNKAAARALAISAGVPVVPGTEVLVDVAEARAEAARIGYPVLLKAAEGGGGKGIREIRGEEELAVAFEEVVREVTAAFGAASLYLEKSLTEVRHIEVQLIGDRHGSIVHLFERDCSLQRRRQKVVEEAPAYGLPDETRAALHRYAVALGSALSYSSAGTVEFLVDADGGIYFIEVNTRIQVEHGITEMITGVDVCAEQLRVAAGAPLSFAQSDLAVSGHAIEARINAENPAFHFLGSPGVIEYCRVPGGIGVRVDTFIETGVTVQPYYDSLIAKVMVHAPTRAAARRRLDRALDELEVTGIATTAGVIRRINEQEWFSEADYSTVTLEGTLPALIGA